MNLDRNQIIGIVLIALMFIGFTYFSPVEEQKSVKKESVLNPKKQTLALASKQIVSATDSIQKTVVPERILQIENKDIKLKISSKGARIFDVVLKNHFNYDKKSNVVLFQKALTNQKTLAGTIDLNDSTLNYSISEPKAYLNVVGETEKITLTATLPNGKNVIQTYIVSKEGFLVEHSIAGTVLNDQSTLGFDLKNTLAVTERKFNNVDALKFERQHTSLNFLTSDDSFEELMGMNRDDDAPELKVQWFTFRSRFFDIGIAPENQMSNVKFETYHGSELTDTNYLKTMSASYKVDLNNKKEYNAKLYYGPNDYYVLDATEIKDFGKNVDMGWLIFGVINRYIILPVFHFLSNFVGNFGLVIFFLVLFIKIVLFPIAYKSYLSMAKMKALKPDIDALKAKHGDNQQAFGAAQMGLYREAGVNPISGCLPQLLQIPVLFALFRFFPNAIQLRQKDFLWANDLSTYDGIIGWDTWYWGIGSHLSIFTILMTVTTLVNTWYNSQFSSMSPGQDNPMAQQMKYMMYFMPLIFFFVLNDYPSGLTYYYFLSTLFTIGQQFVANKMIDTDKLRKSIESNIKNSASGTVKKSRFQQRLEEAMKTQEALKKK